MTVAIKVVLADDHPVVLHGLEQIFARHAEFDVVGCCASGPAALEAVRTRRPDVLVLDLRMPGTSGLDVLRTLAAERLRCRSILLTAAVREEEALQAVRLGARAVVLKDTQPGTLLECVRRVHAGEQWIEPEMLKRAMSAASRGDLQRTDPSLTPRELEIVRMVAHGLRNRVIADRLTISEGTVKVHLHNIYEKLGVDGRVELVLKAQDSGLL